MPSTQDCLEDWLSLHYSSNGQLTQHSLKARPQSWISGLLDHSLHLGWTLTLSFLSHAGSRINADLDYQVPWNNLKWSFVDLEPDFISRVLLGFLHSSAWMSSKTQSFHCNWNYWAMNIKGSGGGGKLDEASSCLYPLLLRTAEGVRAGQKGWDSTWEALDWTTLRSLLSWVLGRLEGGRRAWTWRTAKRLRWMCEASVFSVLSASHV